MRNYFVNLVFVDLVKELEILDNAPENADLNFLGHKMMIITCLIVDKSKLPNVQSVDDITPELFPIAREVLLSEAF